MKLQTQYQSLTSKNQNFSFQFFEWVSIKSRSTYIYNLYLYQYRNWLHWKYVKQNLHQIPLAILDAVIFKLQFDNAWSITTANIFHFVWGSNLVKVITAATVKSSAATYIWKWCYNTFYWQFFFWAVQHLPRVNIYIYAVNEHKLTCCRMLGITNRDLIYWIEMANLNM
jgi:hypothetical protein